MAIVRGVLGTLQTGWKPVPHPPHGVFGLAGTPSAGKMKEIGKARLDPSVEAPAC